MKFYFVIVLSCLTSIFYSCQSELLNNGTIKVAGKIIPYRIIERQDYSWALEQRMKFRVVLDTDAIPNLKDVRVVANYFWEHGNKKWDKFSVHIYLEGMVDFDIAYGSVEYSPRGMLRKPIIVEAALMDSNWWELVMKSKPKKSDPVAAKPQSKHSPNELMDLIIGDWYNYSTYRKSIITDYMNYKIIGGIAIKSINSDGVLEVQKGTYAYDEEFEAIEVKIDKGDSGIQATYWHPTINGSAKIVFWKNLSLGYVKKMDELWIKKNSPAWKKRKKLALSDL